MTALIFQKIKNNMQSGRADTDRWLLQFDQPQGVRADPLTGWQGGGDTQGQVTLQFPTREAAIAFAEREGHDYRVVPTPTRKLKLQTYADNFR